jgi:phage terminase large subunit-like protein
VKDEAKREFRIHIGKEKVDAMGDTRLLEALTSSPNTIEGGRATFVLLNETHHWLANNSGHDMADVIERNATKIAGGAGRTLRITNAYEPGEDSVAERDREAWEKAQAGEAHDVGLFYDSLEAHPDAPLTAEAAPEVVETIRGDSVWLNTDRIVKFILDIRNPPSQSRRWWFNQITAAEDAWADPQAWDSIADAGQLVLPGEPIVAFFDGSKSDDTTGLIGCRMSDGHVFYIDSWSKPAGERGKGWVVPRDDVDESVRAMFDTYEVTAFWADPSDTRDDEGERFWEPFIDDWHQRWGGQLKLWAQKAGDRPHSVAWDMRSNLHQKDFTEAAERFIAEMNAHRFTHDGHLLLKQHVRNARRYPNAHGVSLAKEHRESRRKVDLAVCAVGARMLRRAVQNKDTGTKVRSGRVW